MEEDKTGAREQLPGPCLPRLTLAPSIPPATHRPGEFKAPVSLTPGFQNSSANTTRSAEEKVRPMLAAVMDSTATACFSNSWNCWHRSSRSAEDVEPSMRMCGTCCRDRRGRERGCTGPGARRPGSEDGAALLFWLRPTRAASLHLTLLSELLVFSFQIEICVERIVDSH